MELIDLKREKKDVKEVKSETVCGIDEEERYPYGSRLSLETEEIEKIENLKNF